MTKAVTGIRNMESLDNEINRLKRRCKEIENSLDGNIEALKDNYALMAFNSIIGNRLKNIPFVGAITGTVLNNKKLQDLLQSLFEKISSGIEKWLKKMFPSESD